MCHREANGGEQQTYLLPRFVRLRPATAEGKTKASSKSWDYPGEMGQPKRDSGNVAALPPRMHAALPGKSVWAAVEIFLEVTWESRSWRGSVALFLGLGNGQVFFKRAVKKMGMASQKQDFQHALVWVLPGGWKE